jgi:two-component system, sensor histidine kinase and response regulator
VQDFVARNVSLLTSNAKQKQVTLRSLVQQDVPVYADLYMLDAIIRNLISNAIKFTSSGGTVTITTTIDAELVTISVADTGIGIPAEKLTKLFRIDAKYQRKGTNNEPGTGLGLILCKEFVEKQGGQIWVKSTVGQGTTFAFTVPEKPQQPMTS